MRSPGPIIAALLPGPIITELLFIVLLGLVHSSTPACTCTALHILRVNPNILLVPLHPPIHPPTPTLLPPLQDLSLLQKGQGWWRLFSSGLCNSGLAATWLCCAALQNCGRWLEAGTGQIQVLTIFLLCAACASLGHIFAGTCMLGVAAPGTVLGMYTTWTIIAAQNLQDQVPMGTIYMQGMLLLVLMLGLSVLQPAASMGSLAGGMLGGALASKAGGFLSSVLAWCLAIPVIGGLMLLRVLLDLIKVAWLACVFVAASVYTLVLDFVQTIRGL